MAEGRKLVNEHDIPLDFWELARDKVVLSSVGLVAINTESADARPIGSASLVSVHGRKGLLTAAHVWDRGVAEFGPDESLAFGVHNREQSLRVDRSNLVLVHAFRPIGRAFTRDGPDLALVALPPEVVGVLEAWGLSFHNLDRWRCQAPMTPAFDQGAWLVVGAPAEGAAYTGSSHFDRSLEFKGLCGTSTPVATWERGDFDFYEVHVRAGAEGIPSDYSGLSGGGLWFVEIPATLANDPRRIVPHLTGVWYWQDAQGDGFRPLVAHGPKSIYERLLAAIPASC